eukprot:TRINITY_DN6682_c2_g1_i1.p1 TRINITY_DN6682_c2_g1~~TRINITY_DN6682_c2_g1_i1.p1  ORF type:complete len:1087 (-),score=227.29 TRINITY_DN6682_c2_g1_i1:138-3398(-)
MVIAELLSTAYSTAASAYTYNMNRFQFDAGQQQTSEHLMFNMRIAQWNIFREDTRDLFQLTTANMSTYMVVGTLFFSLGIGFMSVGVANFPEHPQWLMVMWVNCILSGVVFSVMSVWLAMHGTIAAHSASVKVLTQAIRVPFPSADEVNSARQRLNRYEGDPRRFLRVPGMGNSEDDRKMEFQSAQRISAAGGSVPSTMASDSGKGRHGSFGPLRDEPPVMARGPAHSNDLEETGGKGSSSTAPLAALESQARAAEMLADDNYGGPGRGAATDAHIRLFRQMHINYACFDAYARVSLSAGVHDLLLAYAYHALAFGMCKMDGTGPPDRARIPSFIIVLAVIFTNIILFKLDLYSSNFKIRVMKINTVAGPLCTAAAAYCWSMAVEQKREKDLGCHLFVVISTVLHLLWSVQLMYESWPMAGDFKVPMSWRSVRYLDVFGWMESENCQLTEQEEIDAETVEAGRGGHSVSASAILQAKLLRKKINRLLNPNCVEHLTPEEVSTLNELKSTLTDSLMDLEQAAGSWSFMSTDSGVQQAWIQCDQVTDTGSLIPYYVNVASGDVSWEQPDTTRMLRIPQIQKRVRALQERTGCCPDPARATTLRTEGSGSYRSERPLVGGGSWMESVPSDGTHAGNNGNGNNIVSEPALELPFVNSSSMADTGLHSSSGATVMFSDMLPTNDQPASGGEPMPFAPMARRPGSTKDSTSIPWKYYAQVCVMNIALWAFSTFLFLVEIGDTRIVLPRTPKATMRASAYQEEAGMLQTESDDAVELRPSLLPSSSSRLPVQWPHKYFRPTGLACHNSTMLLGDSFSWYFASSPSLAASKVLDADGLQQMHRLRVPDLPAAWRSAALRDEGRLLLLEEPGRSVVEVLLHPGTSSASAASSERPTVERRLQVSQRVQQPLRAIATAGAEAGCPSDAKADEDASLSLFGVTESGDIVLLCQDADVLEPLHTVATIPSRRSSGQCRVGSTCSAAAAAGAAGETRPGLLGMHHDRSGALWAMWQSGSGAASRAEVAAWSPEGLPMGSWTLPAAHRWAPGLCRTADEKAFMVIGEELSRPGGSIAARPALWRVEMDVAAAATVTEAIA